MLRSGLGHVSEETIGEPGKERDHERVHEEEGLPICARGIPTEQHERWHQEECLRSEVAPERLLPGSVLRDQEGGRERVGHDNEDDDREVELGAQEQDLRSPILVDGYP